MNYRCWHLLNNKAVTLDFMTMNFPFSTISQTPIKRSRIQLCVCVYLEYMTIKCWPNRKSVEHSRYDVTEFLAWRCS